MSEELTITVRQEVESFLHLMAAQYRGALGVLLSGPAGDKPGAKEFYNEVLSELEEIAQNYIQGREKDVEPDPDPQQEIEVGDMVELTGRMWGNVKSPKIGERYVVSEVSDADGPSFWGPDGTVWYVFDNESAEWGAKVYKKASEL